MRWSRAAFILVVSSACFFLFAGAHQHGSEIDKTAHLPRVLGGGGGRRSGGDNKDKNALAKIPRRTDQSNERCGPTYGSCKLDKECCSAAGWCGTTADYCSAPDCQLQYGKGCDGNQKPKSGGQDTSGVPRPKMGNVPYGGVGIYDCVRKGDVAITFDDGPYMFTEFLLDILAMHGAQATFFITGNNLGKGEINDPKYPWASIIRRMAKEGHQIASHTWSHQNFTQLGDEKLYNQMIYNEIALDDILGYFPTYMRPPYSICGKRCRSLMSDLGYHIIYFDLDTQGYLHDSADKIQTSKDIWDKAMASSNSCRDSHLQIEHDIHWQTAHNLTGYVLESLSSHGYRAVTVGECLGDPPKNWYRAGSGSVPEYPFSAAVPTRICGAPTVIQTNTKASNTCPGESSQS